MLIQCLSFLYFVGVYRQFYSIVIKYLNRSDSFMSSFVSTSDPSFLA